MPKVSREYYSLHRILTLLVLFIIIIGCDAFIWATQIRDAAITWQIVWWVPSLLLCFTFSLLASGNWGWPTNAIIVLITCIVIPELLYTLSTMAGLAINVYCPGAIHTSRIVGGILAGMAFVCALYGVLFGWKRIITTRINVISGQLPDAFDGYRIAQISDLHLGTFAHEPSFVAKLVRHVNALEADMIVFTGDLVNFTSAEAAPFKDQLSALSAPDGVLSVLGNHDYAIYAPVDSPQAQQRHINRIIKLERHLGWHLLMDENVQIKRGDESIWIVGVQNIGRQKKSCKGDLKRAMRGIPDEAFTVLLSHDPSHWVDEIVPCFDIPLTLSGHTHAMQFKIFGWSPSALISKHWGGHYIDGDKQLFVSTGAGANLPFRFGAWPEVALISLSKPRM